MPPRKNASQTWRVGRSDKLIWFLWGDFFNVMSKVDEPEEPPTTFILTSKVSSGKHWVFSRTRRVFGMVGRWSPMVQCQPQEFQSITSYPPYTIIYGRALFLCPNRPTKMAKEFSSEHHLPVTRVAVGFLEGFGIVVCAVWSSSCLVVNQLHFLILNPISGNGLKPLTTLI